MLYLLKRYFAINPSSIFKLKVYVQDSKIRDIKTETNIPRNVIKELLLLCTKHVHFTFSWDIYIQLDGVAMGSPLGPLLANVSMCLLEQSIVPTNKDCHVHWKRYDKNGFIHELELSCTYPVENWHIKKSSKRINSYML